MKRAIAVVALWAMALSLSGVVAAGTVAPETVESAAEGATATLEDGVVTVVGFGGDVWVAMSNESVSASATTGETTVGLEGLGTENASGSLSSPAVADSSGALESGLCATGLSRPESPLGIETTDDRVAVGFEEYRGENRRDATAESVVEKCAR